MRPKDLPENADPWHEGELDEDDPKYLDSGDIWEDEIENGWYDNDSDGYEESYDPTVYREDMPSPFSHIGFRSDYEEDMAIVDRFKGKIFESPQAAQTIVRKHARPRKSTSAPSWASIPHYPSWLITTIEVPGYRAYYQCFCVFQKRHYRLDARFVSRIPVTDEDRYGLYGGEIKLLRLSRRCLDSLSEIGMVIRQTKTYRSQFETLIDDTLGNLEQHAKVDVVGDQLVISDLPGKVILLSEGCQIDTEDAPDFPEWIGWKSKVAFGILEHTEFTYLTKLDNALYLLKDVKPIAYLYSSSVGPVPLDGALQVHWTLVSKSDESKGKGKYLNVSAGSRRMHMHTDVGFALKLLPKIVGHS